MASALSNSLLVSQPRSIRSLSGTSLKSKDRLLRPAKFNFGLSGTPRSSNHRKALTIQATYRDDGGSGHGSVFVGGFVLGGLIAGTLSYVFAPQISRAISGTEGKDLMKKLPKFIYDEEKAIEKQRQKLAQKIEQLNSAIDNMSSQLRSEDQPNGSAVGLDDIEAVI